MDFTKRKFLSLSPVQQDKLLAELLRTLYIDGGDVELYNLWQGWRGGQSLSDDREAIADAYHKHMQAAGLSLREHRLLPRLREGDKESCSEKLSLAVYLDNLRSAHNVGSIVRSSEAFGLGTIYFSETTPFIDHKQVKDASMGCDKWVVCERVKSLEVLPRPIIALETSFDAKPLSDFVFPKEGTLALGNEEYGCSKALLAAADVVVEIPLYGRKNSLNVANAFAVAAAAVRR